MPRHYWGVDGYSLQRSARRSARRAVDLSERSYRFGRAAQRRGFERWRNRIWMIIQQALGAGLAWLIAQHVFGHQVPVFAAIAAMLTLGSSFGNRLGRALEVAVGVALGVFFGDLFVFWLGRGWWQIMVVIVLAMSVAIFLKARDLMVMQAGVQAVVVIALPLGEGVFARWTDALIGCALALIIAILAPTGPIRKPSQLAAAILTECADVLEEVHQALTDRDLAAADRDLDRARHMSEQIDLLDVAASEGVAAVRYSPFLRRDRSHMLDLAALTVPLDRLSHNVRGVARRAGTALWDGEVVPESYLEVMDLVAAELRTCSAELMAEYLPVTTRDRVIALGAKTNEVELVDQMSSVVILAILRSIMADLLEVTGMTYADARDALSNQHEETPE